MPTYEYRCKDCGHQFETVQRMTDDPLAVCPECDGELKRLIGGGAGIIFKGSGFYATDYRSPDYHQAAKAENSSAKADSGSSATPKADSKATAGDGK